MAATATTMSLFLLIAAVFWSGAAAETSCTSTLMTLSPCLNYVTGNSSSPSTSCCSQLGTVVSSQPRCLCLLLNGTATSYGFNINQTLALALPDACGVQTPPASKCNAATSAPTASPEADTQHAPPATIPSGSKTVNSQNGANNVKAPYNVVVFMLLFIASPYALSLVGL